MNKLKTTKGITLIALVITIIVLLILAGVSIAMLTGDNGILTQANEAKEQTEYKGAEEKVKLAIMGPRADDGQMTVEELTREVGLQGGSTTSTEFPAEVQMDGYTFTVDNTGTVSKAIENDTLGTVTGTEKTNTVVKDSLGNEVKVPAGFKVVNPEETVPDGIVIEDVDATRPTIGSQFVWIPVGEVTKKDKTKVTINLGRYDFDSSGNASECSSIFTEDTAENHNSSYGNTIAKDIENFKTKATASKGYYIGRYEARDKDANSARTGSTSETNQLVCTEENYVYNNVTQSQAANLSRNMYNNSNFESDLINTHPWDTAVLFLHEFDKRENKTKPYSRQNSINTSLATQGTNKLSTPDKICNIFDMASNTFEWSTETAINSSSPCLRRGSHYNNSIDYTSSRSYGFTSSRGVNDAFRPLLYL